MGKLKCSPTMCKKQVLNYFKVNKWEISTLFCWVPTMFTLSISGPHKVYILSP